LFRQFSNDGGNMTSKYHLENSLIDVDGMAIPHHKQASSSHHQPNSTLLEAAYGLWKNQPVDGLVYQAQIRAEWNRPL
jgi:hypothetical protein